MNLSRSVLRMLFVLMISFSACADDEVKQVKPIDPSGLTGIWVPYERLLPDGSTVEVVQSSSIFGFYAESLKWKNDSTYIPVMWQADDNFGLLTQCEGKIALSGNEVHFTAGCWDLTFTIYKHEGNNLWLQYGPASTPVNERVYLKLNRKTQSVY